MAGMQPCPSAHSQQAPSAQGESSGPKWRATTGGLPGWCAGEQCRERWAPLREVLPACAPRSRWCFSLRRASLAKWAMTSSHPPHQVQLLQANWCEVPLRRHEQSMPGKVICSTAKHKLLHACAAKHDLCTCQVTSPVRASLLCLAGVIEGEDGACL